MGDRRVVAGRIVPLEVGRLTMQRDDLVGEPGTMTFPIAAWLIEHPAGLVAFDTGMHPDLQHGTDRIARLFDPSSVDFPSGEELASRLRAVGCRPSDVHVAVISHLHFDHAGGIGELPDARLVVQRAEWAAGHHPKLVGVGMYNPDDFDIGHDVQLVEGTHDVFGDGSIVCIPTPGHTRGHQVLRVELASGPVVLTADCVYFRQMLDQMRVPRHAYDHGQQLESMRLLASLRDDGCRLLFGHDLDQLRSIPAVGLP